MSKATILNTNNNQPISTPNGEKTKKPRQQYKYELIGRITDKRRKKPSPNNQIEGKKYDDYFYQINVILENKPQVNKIFVFKSSLETEKVWQDIENSEYIDQRYLFYCYNYKGLYRLVNWKKLANQETVISNYDRNR